MGKQKAVAAAEGKPSVKPADKPAGKGSAAPAKAEPAAAVGTKRKAKGSEASAGGGADPDSTIGPPASSKKSEIDDIFSAGKKKAQESAAEKRAKEEAAAKADADAGGPSGADAKRPRLAGNKDDIFGACAGKGRSRTEEGFPIYSEEELGLAKSKGGDTDLCPFDCECCF
ncbi:hypothetical protein TSOC_001121 [Tetrabaena socialis]|uniref:DUF1764 domain-containing protein n=1 Tax=Tetrabaena socialis TaxID=47790 RepID=A0A2J8AHL1_9CHLO|nr:hypothetical protein TSOC_001121 [Tetrabaena socialis]|eukprot:PNH12000.1 hypothetical protein TSOC_001121 [Tetrabaena socialis]